MCDRGPLCISSNILSSLWHVFFIYAQIHTRTCTLIRNLFDSSGHLRLTQSLNTFRINRGEVFCKRRDCQLNSNFSECLWVMYSIIIVTVIDIKEAVFLWMFWCLNRDAWWVWFVRREKVRTNRCDARFERDTVNVWFGV